MRHIGDDERRARLARRHAVARGHRVTEVEAAVDAMTVFHATEPATVYLSAVARVDGLEVADVDRALYQSRSVVKQLAMRRTLFAFPRDLLPAALGSASARVAVTEQARLVKDLLAGGLADDGIAHLAAAEPAVRAALSEGEGLTSSQLRERVPELDGTVLTAPGSKWGGVAPFAPRMLTVLGARGVIVRGPNAHHWRTSRHVWTLMANWLGEPPEPLEVEAGYAALVRHWLRTFGPGTETDIVWWLGATKTAVRRALKDLEAVSVSLDGTHGTGTVGWVLPDDLEPEAPVEPWAALLPVLDPTTMGWKERAFYLDPAYVPYLFDTAGNGGSTAWVDGRVVGCWVQDADAAVRVVLSENVGADAHAALDAEAARLTAWLDGVIVNSVYASLQMRNARLP